MKKSIIKSRFKTIAAKSIGLLDVCDSIAYSQRQLWLQDKILYCTEPGISYELYCDYEIVVSLTSYGKRIYDVCLTIESIMQQTMKANRIVLWLDHNYERISLPVSLIKQQKRGLEIRFCDDCGPYKKLYYSLSAYPESVIITIDDDALYDYDVLERLILSFIQDSKFIYCTRCHRMEFNSKGRLKPYNEWERVTNNIEASHLNFATGVGGVLYPPNSLDEEVMNKNVFMNICQRTDDVWWNSMAIKKGTKVKKVYTRNANGKEYLPNKNVQDIGLFNDNNSGLKLNDQNLNKVFEKYNLFEKLSK